MAPRPEKRLQVVCRRSSIHRVGLVPIISASACNVDELVGPANEAVDAFDEIEALLARAAERLIVDFTVEASTSNYLPTTLLVERAIEVVSPDQMRPGSAPSEVARACNEASRRCRKTHETIIKQLRINAHGALAALQKAVDACEPSEDREVANSIADELLQLAERIGLADNDALAELWPRLTVRVVEIERVRHHAARCAS